MNTVRTAVRVEGVVQGVGFRPFVYALATGLGLTGLVGNDLDGVFAEVEGPAAAVSEFLRKLERDAPPLARIERVTTTAVTPRRSAEFVIAASDAGSGLRRTLVSADTATCADCLRELSDPADRRHEYPFINCTNCGPRFTIVRDVPYDRPLTTMAPFEMCERCAAEYHDPADRRFHAQPTCCPACGPRLALLNSGDDDSTDPLRAAAGLLRRGQILAVKGLGGYHLAADAACEQAVAALRARKHREDKPFAVMAADLAAARQLAEIGAAAADLLTSAARPIVLLPRREKAGPGTAVAPATAPANRQLGVMLPYTPLHHLLLQAVARPIVLTSGNVSDEPIAYRDDEARETLKDIADAFLTHDRAIHVRTDDSVARTFRGRPMLVRRSRGYVPEPVPTRTSFPREVLACGAELKNTFCLARGRHAFVSHHIGDLENAETLRSFTEGIEHFRRLFDIDPQVVAHDLHPEYLSTKYALELDGVELQGVQHHHAHIASCLADNGEDGPVIGVAFDGTGYGADGTIWGGEFLAAGLASFERGGHLAPVPMPGGAAAIRQPWRMAAAYTGDLEVARRHPDQWRAVLAMAAKGINSPLDLQRGPPVRRRRRHPRRPRHDQLRGPGRDRARAARRHQRNRRVPSRHPGWGPVHHPRVRSPARRYRGPNGPGSRPRHRGSLPPRRGHAHRGGLPADARTLRPGLGRPVRRRVPEPPPAARHGEPSRGPRFPRPAAFPGAVQRWRHQPRPGRDRGEQRRG